LRIGLIDTSDVQNKACRRALTSHDGGGVVSGRRAEVVVGRLGDLESREDYLAGAPVFATRVAEVARKPSLVDVLGNVVVERGGLWEYSVRYDLQIRIDKPCIYRKLAA
jgi:hypothetical protein